MQQQTHNTTTDWKTITATLLIVISSIGSMAGCAYCAALFSTYVCVQLACHSPVILSQNFKAIRESN